MKYFKVIAVSLAVVTVGVAVFYSQKNFVYLITNRYTSTPKETTLTNQNALQTQTNDEGSVAIKVTPKDLLESSPTWDFEIVLDTHSGNLDQDLTKSALLIDENGNQSTPISWEGDPPEGHHRQGVLKFKQVLPRPNSIELKIAKIGDVDERIFKWELK